MNLVWAIAKRDISGFFNSVRGSIILSVFLILAGFFFSSDIYTYMLSQSRGPMMGGESASLDQLLRAFFYNLQFLIIMVVPAVTMSSFAEERKSHSLRFLQTAPVTPLQIVLGKFIAHTTMLLVVVICASIYPAYCLMYGNPDPGPILVGYAGLILLTASNVAFGLWVSSMTTNQLIAFLFTFLGLLVLLILSWIAPSIGGTGALEGIFKYLATTTHLEGFFKGVLSVSDVVYFMAFTAVFLLFTNSVIDSLRWR
jgi:ABC-2 type transport system permease protein